MTYSRWVGGSPGSWSPRGARWLCFLIIALFVAPTAFVGLISGSTPSAAGPTASGSPAATGSSAGYTVSVAPDSAAPKAAQGEGSAAQSGSLVSVASSFPSSSGRESPTPATAKNLTVSPTSGPVGDKITFTGLFFPHSSSVTVTWAQGKVCTVTTDTTGTFECTYVVVQAHYGNWVFTATTVSGGTAKTTFKVKPGLVAVPAKAPTGTTVSFNGTGFSPNSTVTVSWTPKSSAVTACTAQTKTLGSFVANCTYILPGHNPGEVIFQGKDGAGETGNFTFTILPVLIAVPSSGPVGGVISFLGTNYTPNARVNVSLNSTIECTGVSNSTGAVTCAVTAPPLPAATYLFVGTDNHTNAANTTFKIVPRLTASPSSGPEGTVVLFAGTGFGPDSSISVNYSGIVACEATTNPLGTFSCSFVVPALVAGSHPFVASDKSSKHSAQTTFVVTSRLTASPASGAIGTVVGFNGTGFGSSSPVSVTWSGGTVCSTTTASNGTFACPPFTVPSTSTGTHLFTGTDGLGNSATTTFTVGTKLLASPSSGPVGTTITFRGSNFSADVSVAVTWISGTACGSTTNATGSFSCTFVLTNATVGLQVFTGTDASGTFVTTTFTVTPTLTSTPISGPVGSTPVFSGTGFAPLSAVTVNWSAGAACTATTDARGSFRCSFQIPAVTGKSYTFTATDAARDTALTSFEVNPELVATPSTAVVGTTITFVGSGYASDIGVGIGWTHGVACSSSEFSTSAVGGFSCTFTIPSTAAGPYTFVGTDNASDTASAVVTVGPSVSVSPTEGIVGTYTHFTGLGFAATSSVSVASSLGVACSATSDATGAFSCAYSIPPAAPGAYTFTATDTASHAANVIFTVLPLTLKVSPTSGVVGTSVTFTGTNWADSSTVSVSWSGGKVCNAVPTSASGSFGCTTSIPAMTVGPHTFTATDATGNSTSVVFTVVPRLTATPASGQVGSVVTFVGTGFAGSSALTVSWSLGTACSATTDASGGFSCTFVIPATTAGATVFEGTDAASDVAVTTVVVAPSITINVTAGPVGTSVTFTGTGYAGTSLVIVSWVEGTACSATSTALGNFTCSFEVTDATAGIHPFSGTDASGNTASAGFTIVPKLVATPTVAPDSTSVAFRGSGFAGDANVTVAWTVGAVCTVTTSVVGSFNCTYVLAGTTPGYYTFNATDRSTNTAFVVVEVVPNLTDVPGSGPVGEIVTFTASGFAASSAISVTWAHGTACSGTTSSAGAFVCAFNVTAATPGGYVFTALDSASHSASVVFVLTPLLRVSPTSGPTGTTVTLTGTNYAAGATVTISFGGTTACTGTASPSGAYSCTFVIPLVVGGAHLFTSVDSSGNAASVAFSVTPELFVSPVSGAPGTPITFSGTGYLLITSPPSAAETTVTVTWNGQVLCRGTVQSIGTFSCSTYPTGPKAGEQVEVPVAPAGLLTFLGSEAGKVPESAYVTFEVTPTLTVTPGSGPVGTVVTFTGTAFAANSSVSITGFGGTACLVITDQEGNFTCTYTIPAGVNGEHVFSGTDLSGNTALTEFGVTAALAVSPSPTTVGTVVTIVGTGYGPDLAVTVEWSVGTVCSTTTNASGGFVCDYTLPATVAGAHTFTGTDGQGSTASAILLVVPLLEESVSSGPVGTTITFSGSGYAAGSLVSVTWAGGAACSGTAASSGSFSCAFEITAAVEGGHTFTGEDASNNTASVTFTVTSALSATPSSAGIGTLVTFTGTGFAPNSLVTVTWTEGTACTQTSNSAGSFSCSFTVPPAVGGAHSFTATDRASNTAATVVTVTAQLDATPTRGLEGVVVTFSALGFSASSTITISWHLGTACTGTTNASGSFSCTFTIPQVVAGAYQFTATDAASNSASMTFTVTPLLTIGTASGSVGTVVTFTGSDYAGNSAVTVSWTGGTACTATTNASGGFTCSFTVSAATVGSHTFTAADASGNSAAVGFVVTTRLTVVASSGPVGTVVTFAGTGYDATSAVTVTWGGGTACTATTSALGSFTCTFTIPSSTAGAHPFTGTDAGAASAVATFTVIPQLSLDVSSGPVGTSITFTADGFAAGSSLTITWPDGTVCTGTTNSAGELSCPYVIPATAPGGYVFTAKDGASNTAVAAFTVVPQLTVGPVGGLVGASVTFTGTNFAPDSTVSVTEGAIVLCTTTTSGTGGFSCSATVPLSTAGSHIFTATDGSGNVATTSFTVSPHLTASSSTETVGATITFDGTGYSASEVVTVSWSGGVACSATTNATGSFGCAFVIPSAIAGAHLFTGTDPTSDTAEVTVTVTSLLTVSVASGPVGTTVTFTGTGFGDASALTVKWTGGTACSLTTSAAGSFSCTFKIPLVATGRYSFTATDAASNTASVLYAVVPALLVSVGSGPVGTSLSLSGSGFASDSAVTVVWGATSVCTPATDSNGSFACTFVIPASPAGAHSFVATDADLNVASATFTVDPTLSVGPSSGPVGTSATFAGTGFAADSGVTVMWGKGPACSATTNGLGSFSCTFTLPSVTTGDYAFMATDGSGDTAMTHFTVTVFLAVSLGTGPVGTTVNFTGTGFAPDSSVNVTGLGAIACSAITDASGGFNCTFVLPPASAGSHTFTATDGLENSATARFVVTPSLKASPSPTSVGSSITFQGTGFRNASVVNVTWSGGAVCSATTDSKGDFTCSFKLTAAAAGSHSFNATDSVGNRASASISVTPVLSASPLTTASGNSVVFTGTGFAANSYVAVTWALGVACSTTTSANGSFACTLNHPSPAPPAGAYPFTATDSATNTAAVSVTFTPPPAAPVNNDILGLDPYTFYTVLVFAILAAAIAIAAVLVHRGRKGRQPAF